MVEKRLRHSNLDYRLINKCLTEASFINLDLKKEQIYNSDDFNLKQGEVCHFKFNLPKDNWRGVIIKITKASNINFNFVLHRWRKEEKDGYRQEYEYVSTREGVYYSLGGGDIKEVILTVIPNAPNPIIEFKFMEGWVTMFSRPVFYSLIVVGILLGVSLVSGVLIYCHKYIHNLLRNYKIMQRWRFQSRKIKS